VVARALRDVAAEGLLRVADWATRRAHRLRPPVPPAGSVPPAGPVPPAGSRSLTERRSLTGQRSLTGRPGELVALAGELAELAERLAELATDPARPAASVVEPPSPPSSGPRSSEEAAEPEGGHVEPEGGDVEPSSRDRFVPRQSGERPGSATSPRSGAEPVEGGAPVADPAPIGDARPPAHWAALVDRATAPALDRDTESWRARLREDVQRRPDSVPASRHWTHPRDLEAHESAVASKAATTTTVSRREHTSPVTPPVTVRPPVTDPAPVTVRPPAPIRPPVTAPPVTGRPVTAPVTARTVVARIPTPTRPLRHTDAHTVGDRPRAETQTSPASWPELLTELDAPEVAPGTDEGWRLDRLMAEQEGRTWSG
jgi:hypothetical protein